MANISKEIKAFKEAMYGEGEHTPEMRAFIAGKLGK